MSINRQFIFTITLLLALTARIAGQDNATPAAKRFAVGIKVGAKPITTDPRVVPFSPLFDHFTFGPEVEMTLPHGLGLECDALHKHYAYGDYVLGPTTHDPPIGITDTHVSYWDFPVILKWRTIRHRFSPFLSGELAASGSFLMNEYRCDRSSGFSKQWGVMLTYTERAALERTSIAHQSV
jgi:hypothetical protein